MKYDTFCYMFCGITFRFLVAPILHEGRNMGPASRTFYPDLPPSDRNVETSGRFRSELSSAFSHTFLLRPHAIVSSYFDERSIWDYRDQSIIDQFSRLYPSTFTPLMDLRRSTRSVYNARLVYQQTHTLRP